MKRQLSHGLTFLYLFSLILSFSFVVGVAISEENTQLSQAYDFMNKNLIGKTLLVPVETYKIDNGKMEAVFGRESTYSNLKMTEEKVGKDTVKGFTYDVKTSIKNTTYKLDPNGKRLEPGEVRDRDLWARCFVTMRDSTGELFGVCHSLNENGEIKNTSSTGVLKIWVKDGKLFREYRQLYYNDCYDRDSKTGWRPCASESEEEIYLNTKGKVESKTTYKSYNVDPVTLKRTPDKARPVTTIVSTEK